MLGKGLLQGMGITLRAFFAKKETLQYPEAKLVMPERFRGGELELDHKKCIACGLCALACPNNVIALTTDKGENNKKYLTSYKHKAGLCLFCNLCLEACPTKALSWTQDYEMSVFNRGAMTCDCLAASRKKEQQAGAAAPQVAGEGVS